MLLRHAAPPPCNTRLSSRCSPDITHPPLSPFLHPLLTCSAKLYEHIDEYLDERFDPYCGTSTSISMNASTNRCAAPAFELLAMAAAVPGVLHGRLNTHRWCISPEEATSAGFFTWGPGQRECCCRWQSSAGRAAHWQLHVTLPEGWGLPQGLGFACKLGGLSMLGHVAPHRRIQPCCAGVKLGHVL